MYWPVYFYLYVLNSVLNKTVFNFKNKKTFWAYLRLLFLFSNVKIKIAEESTYSGYVNAGYSY